MNTAQDYLNTLEGFPENQSLLDKENLCKLLEGYWEWRESGEWVKVSDKLPEVESEKFGDTEYCLCIDATVNEDLPFVAWYNHKQDKWTVSHHFAASESAKVTHWRKLPTLPK